MLLLDDDYLSLYHTLKGLTERMKIDFQRKDLNKQGFGDVVVYGLDGIYSGEIKQAGEYLGDIDHLIAQTKAQMAAADFMFVFIYGETTMAPDGNSYSLKIEREDETWNNHPDSGMVRRYRRRHHRVKYQAQRKILWRFRNEGIHVIECRDLSELAYELCLWHETATTVGTVFTRLNVEKFRVKAESAEKEAFMKTLMGIQGAGIGEEVAEALTNHFSSVAEIVNYFNNDGERETGGQIETALLRSGKRTIGPAAVAKLKTALGLKE